MALTIRPRISPERTVARRPLGIMTKQFFEKPTLSSPYAYPVPRWEIDKTGQPTQQIISKRRPAEFNIPKLDSSNTDEIACWFIDAGYKQESLLVLQAWFLGANDLYKALKTEISEEASATLKSNTSRAFDKPESGRIAVKVVNHLGG